MKEEEGGKEGKRRVGERKGGEGCPKHNNPKTRVEKCTRCGELILRKISKIGATRCLIFRLKCTKSDFCVAPSQTPLGELELLQTP